MFLQKKYLQNFSRVISALVLFFVLACSFNNSVFAQQLEPLIIKTVQGDIHKFQVEVANNDETRQKGLMFRESMPFNHGMLFDFQRSIPVAMWMKNTYISLDMLFIRADGTIARIAENTKPLSTEVIPSGEPVLSVLELVGGVTKKLGIKPGDRVEHPLFPH